MSISLNPKIAVQLQFYGRTSYPRTKPSDRLRLGLALLWRARTNWFGRQPKRWTGTIHQPVYPKDPVHKYWCRPSQSSPRRDNILWP